MKELGSPYSVKGGDSRRTLKEEDLPVSGKGTSTGEIKAVPGGGPIEAAQTNLQFGTVKG